MPEKNKSQTEFVLLGTSLYMLSMLPDASGMKVLKALRRFWVNGERPDDLTDEEEPVFDACAADVARGLEQCRKRQEHAEKAANARWHSKQPIDVPKQTSTAHAQMAPPGSPPTDAANPTPAAMAPEAAPTASEQGNVVRVGFFPVAPGESPGALIPSEADCINFAARCGYSKLYGEQFYQYNHRKGWSVKGIPVYDWKTLFLLFTQSKNRKVTNAPPQPAYTPSQTAQSIGGTQYSLKRLLRANERLRASAVSG